MKIGPEMNSRPLRISPRTVREWLTVFVSLAVCAIAVAQESAAPEPGAQQSAARTFRDVSGKFEIKATVLRVEKETVVLRRESGQEIVVRLDALSEADRKFLAGLAAPKPMVTAPPTPFDQFVFPTWKLNGVQRSVPGLVIAQHRDVKYCISPPGADGLIADDVELPWNAGGVWRRPVGKRVAVQQFSRLFVGNAAELPVALPTKSPIVAVGDSLTVWCYGLGSPYEGSYHQEKFRAEVTELLRTKQGEVLCLKLNEIPSGGLATGIATDAKGQPVACLLPALQSHLVWSRNDESAALDGNKNLLFSFEALSHLLAPRLVGASLALVPKDGKYEYELAVAAQDPLQQLKEVRVQVKRLPNPVEAIAVLPFGFAPRSNEATQPLEGGIQVKLENREPTAAAWKQLDLTFFRSGRDSLRTSSDRKWIGTFAAESGDEKKSISFDIQLQYTDASGQSKTLPIRQVSWKYDFFARIFPQVP
jgi:hypothetical protein